ncbi:hypothetical protein QUC31_011356 [Theobroma cacao]
MASLPQKTVQHFTHDHPLTEVDARTEFVCDGFRTLGVGTRYGCESCDFDLHDHCATCPLELSSFMHEHDLKLVVSKPQATSLQNERFCDLCGDPVQGIFYQCRLCEFDVHPLCTKLPEYVRHVMHKEHPLRLQGSVPGRCMVCKDTCTSWHYRCGICCFDLHLECVLAPCEEEATSTSTSRSLKSPVPSPSPSAPSLCNAYGYGAIPPPPSPSAPSLYNAYGYGAIPPPPSSSARLIMFMAMEPFNHHHHHHLRLIMHMVMVPFHHLLILCMVTGLLLMAMEPPPARAGITSTIIRNVVVKFRELGERIERICMQ